MIKIVKSLAMIALVGAVALGITGAYFSDEEKSTGNTFTAGTLDLKIDLDDGAWENPWVGPFFEMTDMKPGDQVEKTISLHVDNDAWLCLWLTPTGDDDNGCNEPECEAENGDWDTATQTCSGGTSSCNTPGPNEGELDDNLEVLVWQDNGDNIYEDGDIILYYGSASGLNVPVGPYPLTASTTDYIGIKACVGTMDLDNLTSGTNPSCDGATVENIIQSDSFTADVEFYVEQQINNPDFTCTAI